MATHLNKFVVDDGYDTLRTDLEQASHDGFAKRADHVIDPGIPFGPSRKVTPSAAGDLTADCCQIGDSCHIDESTAV